MEEDLKFKMLNMEYKFTGPTLKRSSIKVGKGVQIVVGMLVCPPLDQLGPDIGFSPLGNRLPFSLPGSKKWKGEEEVWGTARCLTLENNAFKCMIHHV